MTEGASRPKTVRHAFASRIFVAGASAAATLGLVGGMAAAARHDASASAPPPEQPTPPVRVIVVVKRVPAVSKARSVRARPRIIRRYVTAPAPARRMVTTTTKGS